MQGAKRVMGPILAALTVLQIFCLLPAPAVGQQDFTITQVPTFRVGVFYPGRSNARAEDAETQTCRAITDRIDRNSARYNNELVRNTATNINFATSDARIMSSRMQSRLDDLARRYRDRFGRTMTVLKAWTPYPDSDLSGDDKSLHYEGEKILLA